MTSEGGSGLLRGDTNPQDIAWDLAEAILDEHLDDGSLNPHFLRPHRPHRMRSAQSLGPITAWCCDRWRQVLWSTATIAPVCDGGWGVP
jgi:hypothetical protein